MLLLIPIPLLKVTVSKFLTAPVPGIVRLINGFDQPRSRRRTSRLNSLLPQSGCRCPALSAFVLVDITDRYRILLVLKWPPIDRSYLSEPRIGNGKPDRTRLRERVFQ